jgi:tRNA nucleotidyltransferase/poly(A) polymerase
MKDIYNKDFTINMLAYNILTDEIEDKVGVIDDFKNKIIRTKLDAESVLKENPMIIFRAMILKLKYGFKISEDLQVAMIENAPLIFDGRYEEGKIAFARESVKAEGKDEAEKLFNEFGLTKLNSLEFKKGEENANSN